MSEIERKLESDRVIISTDLQEEFKSLPKQNGFSTGFRKLDYFLRDVREGDLIILTGLTGQGKSAFGVSLTKNFLMQGLHSLWFSFELSSQELFERFGVELPVFYLPRLISSKSVEWIEKKIGEAVDKFGTKVVFIDHLHYLTDDSTVRNRNMAEILGNMCRQFKMIARHKKIIIVLLAHTRKIRDDKHRPTIDDLKDSSGIAQEADTVLIVQRKGKRVVKSPRKKIKSAADELFAEEEDQMNELSTDVDVWIDKNRRTGRLGSVRMAFDPVELQHKEYE